jgi:phosphatidate phosphatase APP1
VAAVLSPGDHPAVADEQVILFPALARPLGSGRWSATIRAVIFRPCERSIRRRLLVRAIAKAANVGESPILRERLRRTLAPFLVDNCSRRRITVEVANQRAELGPSGRNGRVSGEIIFTHRDPAIPLLESRTVGGTQPGRASTGTVRLLPRRGLSVISDIDDTIKHSSVPDTRELLRNTFLRPSRCIAHVRDALASLSARGASVHYVSASPWQLYPALRAFIKRAGLPDGSFHLKDFRPKDRTALSLIASPQRFKTPIIEQLMDSWPRRRFILLGDSTERDPEIYSDVARKRPHQVVGVVIRSLPEFGGCDPQRLRGLPSAKTLLLDDASDWPSVADRLGI